MSNYHKKLLFLVIGVVSMILVGFGIASSDPNPWTEPEQDQEESDQGQEERVTLAQVPAPVKATIEQEAKGGTLKVIKKAVVDGRTRYWADVNINGKEQGAVIGEDGAVFSRHDVKKGDGD